LTVTLSGVPGWVEQGPRPINNAQLLAAPNNAAGGAVQSIAVDRNNAANIWLGTVNGGVWRSTNANPAAPGPITWNPLTDQFGSLSIGSVAVSPLDATGNTVFAGTGNFSNGFEGDGNIGVLRTNDGGNTWTQLGANIAAFRVKEILPTAVDLDPGAGVQQLVLVGAVDGGTGSASSFGGGIFRTTLGGGNNFTQGATGLPAGRSITQLIVDPNNATTFYATVLGFGVYISTDGAGATWTQINGTGANTLTGAAAASSIEITAQNNGGATTLFAGIGNTTVVSNVFSSTDNGQNWTALAAPPAALSASTNFSEQFNIVADPANANVVYLSGQGGGNPIFRYNPAGAGSWVQIAGQGNAQGNTRPHADARDLEFLNNNTLLECDDGGFYFMQNPINAAANPWQSFNGNLGTIEFYSTAFDTSANLIFGGAQDNGSSIQSAPNSTVWNFFQGGDGQAQAYDAASNIRYALGNNFGGTFSHNGTPLLLGANATDVAITGASNANPIVITSNNHGLATGQGVFIRGVTGNTAANGIAIITVVDANNFSLNGKTGNGAYGGGGTWRLIGLNANDLTFATSGTFNNFLPVETNPFTANALLFGRSGVYESNAQGDVITNITANAAGFSGTARSLAYGGTRAGVNQPNVAYIGTTTGQLFFRGEAGAAFTIVSGAGTGQLPGGQSIIDITADPQDWRRVYVVRGSQVWMSNNVTDLVNNAFVNVTNNLGTLSGSLLRSITLFDNTAGTAGDSIPLAGGLGGVFRMLGSVWSEFGSGLPNTVVEDARFIAGSNLLIAGTFGRGAWTIPNVSANIAAVGTLTINGDMDFANEADAINLIVDAANPTLLDVRVNGTLFGPFQQSLIQQINVNALGNTDALTLDFANGTVLPPGAINYDGGTGANDRLILQNGTFNTEVYNATGPGAGNITLDGATINFSNLSPIDDTLTVSSFTLNGPATNDVINVSDTTIGATAATQVASSSFELINFANKSNVTLAGGGGDDTFNLATATFISPALNPIVRAASGSGDDENSIAAEDVEDGGLNVAAGLLTLALRGDGGDDTFNVHAGTTVPLTVDGGAQGAVGDRLNMDGETLTFTFTGTSFTNATRQTVTYSTIETVGLANGFFASSGAIAPNVVVNNLATLGGTANIAGVMTALAGSTVAPADTTPGVSTVGTLTVGGALFFTGSTYRIDINGLVPGTEHDLLVVNGIVNLDAGGTGGATLDVTLGFVALPGQDLLIIRNDLADGVLGTFAQSSLATFGTTKFAIDYTFPGDADGFKNDVALIRFGAALGPDPCETGLTALFVSASTGNDLIEFVPATGNSRMEVFINGTSEGVFRPSIHGLLIVYGQDGNDTINFLVPSRVVLAYGNDGNDTINTGNNNGILLGGDDNDRLFGGNAGDLLIGGRGADRLEARNGKDILVGGFSTFEGNTPANQMALCKILDGANLFTLANVFDDLDVDTLLGGNGQDRFFMNLAGGVALDTSDRSGNELATDLV
jgi:hypothetical protein